jgi:hypothetical protein
MDEIAKNISFGLFMQRFRVERSGNRLQVFIQCKPHWHTRIKESFTRNGIG